MSPGLRSALSCPDCGKEGIKDKYNLSPVQMITFGFICPDHEFQARMTTFMYQQL